MYAQNLATCLHVARCNHVPVAAAGPSIHVKFVLMLLLKDMRLLLLQGLRFMLFAGQPIGEPIVQHGPFVMNNQEEIQQAFMDYQSGKLQSADNVWQAW
jgi:redox-sensitive bicupin YhaK (pirin superfamily)